MHFNQLLRERYSIREYKSQKVSKALLMEVLEAGRLAPSAANKQPWKFIVVSEEDNLSKLKSAYNREWFKKVPQIIVVCGDHSESWKRSFDSKDHCDIDIAIAVDHMTIRASELGLGTCWVCHFDPVLVKDLMQLPDSIEPIALLPIGYPLENKPPYKIRKNLDEIVFEERFGNPLRK
nr:nitroreductase family protein [uncultured Carboxylicivirga sp.]